jgi:hypothetical protein
MYNYAQYSWPAQDLQGVALTQNIVSVGNLLLNGTYSTLTNSTINFFNRGFIPNLSLTSTNNLSAVTFTINGVQNSTVISEVISGPNNNTVYTTNSFDIISSISVASSTFPVNGIKVGTGLIGYLPLFTIPSSGVSTFAITSSLSPYALGFITQSVNGVTYKVYQSLTNLINDGQTYSTLINNSSVIQKGSSYVGTTQILQFTDVVYNLLVSITAANSTSTLQTQFLQL